MDHQAHDGQPPKLATKKLPDHRPDYRPTFDNERDAIAWMMSLRTDVTKNAIDAIGDEGRAELELLASR